MLPITQALTTEHAVFISVFNKIEQLLPGVRTVDEVKLLGALVEALLKEHSAAETDLAYAALDHALDQDGRLDRLHQDHHEIDARLQEIQTAQALTDARQLLKRALDASREHFEREELQVFPLLERTLHPESLAQLGDGWMEQRRAAA